MLSVCLALLANATISILINFEIIRSHSEVFFFRLNYILHGNNILTYLPPDVRNVAAFIIIKRIQIGRS